MDRSQQSSSRMSLKVLLRRTLLDLLSKALALWSTIATTMRLANAIRVTNPKPTGAKNSTKGNKVPQELPQPQYLLRDPQRRLRLSRDRMHLINGSCGLRVPHLLNLSINEEVGSLPCTYPFPTGTLASLFTIISVSGYPQLLRLRETPG